MTENTHLDVYLNGIRQKFKLLNHELDDARNQLDEYKRNYMNQAKELQELRQTVFGSSKGHVCHHCKSSYFSNNKLEEGVCGDNVLRENYTSNEDETRKDFTISDNASLSLRSAVTYFSRPADRDATYSVKFNRDTKAVLKLNLVHTLIQNTDTAYAAFSADGKNVATVSEAGIMHVFDVKTGKRLSVMRDLYKSGNDKAPAFLCLKFSADGRFLATGELDGDVKIWIVSQRRVRNAFKYEGAVRGLDFSPNGQCIAIACGDTLVIRRLRDGFSRVLQQSLIDICWSVRYSQDGRHVALSGGDVLEGQMRILNVRMGKYLARHATGGHAGAVRGLVFTPDGKGLLSGSSWDTMITHWDMSWLNSTYDGLREDISTRDLTGGLRETSRLVGHSGCVYAISLSPDGNWIASGSWDKTVRIWDAHTATLQCVLHGHGPVVSVDFSRVGNHLAVADDNGQVTVWNYRKLEIEQR